MSVGNKARILRLCQLLYKETDSEHYMATNELIEMIRSEGFEINRKTFRDDIDTLIEMGVPIEVIKSSPNKYYCNQELDMDLLKKLYEVVSVTNVFEESDIRRIQKALKNMMSRYQMESLNHFAGKTNEE